ncbi:YncE family protein [Komagataeibacter swingsii]|uniref:Quinohemoprotein amine dehydrogenase subunit beta n=1 Tax=Komagataeibacter swingsii TaxID=215220 RepID=A0A2V4R2E8_9PROT|nr:hypothetical protein [Komagataeibacter swingsii]PYD68913.1 hypothetical protein CFR76_12520 [Komagataeibacter swingsii]GBQ63837.1 hypothetical protein AA16373_2759 [Komagataeibacter swingsii DSM 16373]
MNMLRPALALFASAFAFVSSACAGTVVLGGYPDQLQFINDINGTVVQKVTLETGLPASIQLSANRSRIYVRTLTTSGIEVLDATSHKVLTRFSLNTPVTKYRFSGGIPDASGHYFYATGWRMDKEIDRYRFSRPQYFQIDMNARKIIRAVDMADEDISENSRGALAISPDEKILYVFDKKLRVISTTDFKVIQRIDLAKPDLPWKQDISMGSALETLRDPRHYVSLFQAEDPYIHNKVFGIAHFDLVTRNFSFHPVGPAPKAVDRLQVTPDGRDGYTVVINGEYGNQRCEFWHFDLNANIAMNKAEFPCRRRFYFGMSEDGKKLYIYGAGFDVAVYDAKSLKYETDWVLGNDITMSGIITLKQ